MKSNHNIIRELLKQHPNGLKSREIAAITGIEKRSVNKALENVFGVYIARWERSAFRNTLSAVWVVVNVPDNCPRPDSIGRLFYEPINNPADAVFLNRKREIND